MTTIQLLMKFRVDEMQLIRRDPDDRAVLVMERFQQKRILASECYIVVELIVVRQSGEFGARESAQRVEEESVDAFPDRTADANADECADVWLCGDRDGQPLKS